MPLLDGIHESLSVAGRWNRTSPSPMVPHDEAAIGTSSPVYPQARPSVLARAPATSSTASEPSGGARRRSLSPEEAQRAAEQAHQRWVDRYDHETTDPKWAPGASRSLGLELEQLGSNMGFRSVGTTCKTTMCAASLEWPAFGGNVSTSVKRLVEHMYEQNCARTIYHIPPPDPSGPYRLTMYFDCENSRIQAGVSSP